MRHCRAVERPVRDHDRPSLFSCGTTSVRMGIGGLRRSDTRVRHTSRCSCGAQAAPPQAQAPTQHKNSPGRTLNGKDCE